MLAPVPLPLQIALMVLVTIAAICDLRTRKIPNVLVGPAALVGLAAQLVLLGFSGLRNGALGFGLGLLLYLPLWLVHARGAGDVKLLAAAGAYLGPGNVMAVFLTAALLGGVVALLLVLGKNRIRQTAVNVAGILGDLLRFKQPRHTLAQPGAIALPHAPVIAIASVAVLAMIRHARLA